MRKADVEQKLKGQKYFLESHFFVEKIGIFGSYARDEQTDESDIDILTNILEAINKIESYTEGVDVDSFSSNQITIL
jgi:predicted nucleotidyltransferase